MLFYDFMAYEQMGESIFFSFFFMKERGGKGGKKRETDISIFFYGFLGFRGRPVSELGGTGVLTSVARYCISISVDSAIEHSCTAF